ncbi:hypothetical protein AQI88_08615 [Streptomyces cellostaticus]|uniref:Uncharacterized protein n=1 Tax=Streptomyces cellostaticus TaxID=67285 RepID=A0A101NQ13_9ACTN|nr:hypothetical protein [Streptomyces cellostaticus]KUM97318.1 hypothetical protein AQI88_08615 [Streptomyces cellostaticus]GHI03875.1 hypothetical protein Scel_21960 [Streptomyces cellostaticus]
MNALVFHVTTAALMVLMFKSGVLLIGEDTLRRRPVPWAAVALTAVAIGAVLLQVSRPGAMDALEGDPRRTGWWRVVTSVFMQNGGFLGGAWNIVTPAAVAAPAQWFWGGPLMPALFAGGILLPERIDALFGETSHSTDPRNFAGSSGATYFLAATLTAALLLTVTDTRIRLPAAVTPVAGLAMWLAQDNGHGLVSCYGFLLGCAALPLARCLPRPVSSAP